MAARSALLIGIASCVLFAACGTETSRIEAVWLLDTVAVDGVFAGIPPDIATRTNADAAAWFAFDPSGSFRGEGPCNDISGTYDFDGSSLTTAGIVMSAAACGSSDDATEPMMDLERLVFEASTEPKVHFSSDIRMQWEAGNVTMTFRRQP